jgi:uncharacterized protein
MTFAPQNNRLHVVDALRGFALAAIALLHNIEHFDFYFTPEGQSAWLASLDKGIWNTLFFLFAGKAYSIFALLFGLTFFIQSDNQARKGRDFKARFAWRLLLLFCFGLLNSLFYQGDILETYAVIGFVLIPASLLGNRAVFWLAFFCLLQPIEWYQVLQAVGHPVDKLEDPASWALFGKMASYITGESFLDTIRGNITNGRKAVALWTWESGRVTQTAGLFMLGMLAGRKGLFRVSPESIRFWKQVLVVAASAFLPLFFISLHAAWFSTNAAVLRPLQTVLNMWSNMAFTAILLAGFFLVYQNAAFHSPLNTFAPLGRMSMSNYIIQSALGSFIYYGYGLGMYAKAGSTYAMLIGNGLIALQILFCRWWLRRHQQGPFETIWHRLTWISSQK